MTHCRALCHTRLALADGLALTLFYAATPLAHVLGWHTVEDCCD